MSYRKILWNLWGNQWKRNWLRLRHKINELMNSWLTLMKITSIPAWKKIKNEILVNRKSLMASMNISLNKKSEDFPFFFFLIPKLHKVSFKQLYFAGSSVCILKELYCIKFCPWTKDYCRTVYSCSYINHIRSLQNL